ncbi:Hypothetical predicted protein [Xyrichtys novacula]|uniref:Uncharacterized protein n=1 Tax=Xyrichtys novacula TaxID=13765 RepID=A0AAV1G5Z0_XYRNO|nr:Hypothetical predicted protein [Xyrichtys novacula]
MCKTYVLMTEGKVVTIRSFERGEMKMCAIDSPDSTHNDHVVQIHKRTSNNKQQMAFCFPWRGNSYCIKVVDKCLKVEMANYTPDKISDNQWFVMQNDGDGDNYSLSPLVAPRCCLAVLAEKPYTFILSDNRSDSVQVTAETIEGVNPQSNCSF